MHHVPALSGPRGEMTVKQKQQILELSTQRVYSKYRRMEMRQVFYGCAQSGGSVSTYTRILQDALIVVARADAAIAAIEGRT